MSKYLQFFGKAYKSDKFMFIHGLGIPINLNIFSSSEHHKEQMLSLINKNKNLFLSGSLITNPYRVHPQMLFVNANVQSSNKTVEQWNTGPFHDFDFNAVTKQNNVRLNGSGDWSMMHSNTMREIKEGKIILGDDNKLTFQDIHDKSKVLTDLLMECNIDPNELAIKHYPFWNKDKKIVVSDYDWVRPQKQEQESDRNLANSKIKDLIGYYVESFHGVEGYERDNDDD
ncbi:MAG: hypothetical protein Terrestrivirus1_173 [Terrestrivirus sp.]|uniref:Uncharacterized protein n=1 Tax=Terrestrivirus sp. TaxID=2487775 RepID=A0A3G4ZPC3_9VIRU|nr:MAG: hypothetical protein Terrestrivirus1_173 [Terrestrivirus sp.]